MKALYNPKPILQNDTLNKNNKSSLLIGIWAINEEANAQYWIKKDSIYFIDNFTSYSYKLTNNKLYIYLDDIVSIDSIILLSKDSLWLQLQELYIQYEEYVDTVIYDQKNIIKYYNRLRKKS